MDEAPEIRFHALIHPLRLAVRLGMIGGAHTQLNTSKTEQLLPKVASEHSVTIGDQRRWHTMKSVDSIHVRLGHRRCSVWVPERNKVCKFRELIDDDQNTVHMARTGKSLDEIQRNHLPGR